MSYLSTVLVILAGVNLLAMVMFLVVATRSAREVRATIFPIVREEGTMRMWRARAAASVAGVVAALMAGAFFLSERINVPSLGSLALSQTNVAQRETTVEPSWTAAPAATATDTVAPPTQPATDVPAATQPAIPAGSAAALPPATVTSSSTPPPTTATPPSAMPTTPSAEAATATSPPATQTAPAIAFNSPVTTAEASAPASPLAAPGPRGTPQPAPAGVHMGPIVFAAQVNDRYEPVQPSQVFSGSISRVYAIFPFSGMDRGVRWSQVWYFNGLEFMRDDSTWQWGQAASSFIYARLVGAGNYKLDLYVNDEVVATGTFTVEGPAAIGGPPSP